MVNPDTHNLPVRRAAAPDGNVLVAAFNTPGRIDILTPSGRIVWTYGPPSGPGSLDQPSLALALPNDPIAVTDDWHHRVVVIDRTTKRSSGSTAITACPDQHPAT